MNDATDGAVALRHRLHRRPELSGTERETARTIAEILTNTHPSRVITGIGGHGVAACYDSGTPGPRVLLRAELDALPIADRSRAPHRSECPDVSHACGHDGHAAILASIGVRIGLDTLGVARGSVILLFQPAEETGAGGAAVVRDPRWKELSPDYAFALHNLPGTPIGTLVYRPGVFAAASRGVIIHLDGASAHAAHPEHGRSPSGTVARALLAIDAIASDAEKSAAAAQPASTALPAATITAVHARLGEPGFGTSPGDAVVMATLRGFDPDAVDRMEDALIARITAGADAAGIAVRVDHAEAFPATVNDPAAVALLLDAAAAAGLPAIAASSPFRWSEDFGHIGALVPSAYCCVGAGVDHPDLHTPDYDFPDALLPIGIDLYSRLIEQLCG